MGKVQYYQSLIDVLVSPEGMMAKGNLRVAVYYHVRSSHFTLLSNVSDFLGVGICVCTR